MRLSVLVCTHNRSHAVRPCLDSIVQSLSNAAPIDAEIVVIDNASADDTATVLKAWAVKSPFPVNLQFEARKGASYARNCGLRAARGSLLVWTDDDCRLVPDYIATALTLDSADGEELVLRGGRVVLGDATDYPISITWRQEPRRWHAKKHQNRQLGSAFIGANMMMRRALVDKLGPFDERFGPGSSIPAGEETDYIYRAYAAGLLVEFVPDLIVYHHHGRKTIADAHNVMRNYQIAAGAVLAKHALRFPLKAAAVLLHIKNALLEVFTDRKNRYMPDIGFSYRHLVACFAIGITRFASASRLALMARKLLRRINHSIRWRLIHYYFRVRDYSRAQGAQTSIAWRWEFRRSRRPHLLPAPLIVSLTSYPPRFRFLPPTLRCLLRQSIAADHTILWIAHADLPHLPRSVLDLQKEGLEIRETDDLKSYKKIFPALDAFPDAYICTADDDLYFWPTWLEELVQGASLTDRVVPCHRANDITFDAAGRINPYNEWAMETRLRGTRKSLFPTNGAGTLFPPGVLAHTAEDRAAAVSLCPNGDDIWLYWIGRKNHATYKTVGRWRRLQPWWGSQENGLWRHNLLSGGNDEQILRMAERYGYPDCADRA